MLFNVQHQSGDENSPQAGSSPASLSNATSCLDRSLGTSMSEFMLSCCTHISIEKSDPEKLQIVQGFGIDAVDLQCQKPV